MNIQHAKTVLAHLEKQAALARNPDGTLRNCFNCAHYRIPLRRAPWCTLADSQTDINATCADYRLRDWSRKGAV